MPYSPIDRVLAAFPDAIQPKPGHYLAICPAHADTKPSLSIDPGDGGKVLLKCRAGCETSAVLAARGLTLADLMPKNERPFSPPGREDKGRVTAAYVYVNERNEALSRVQRFEYLHKDKDFRQARSDGSGGWLAKMGDVRRVPYRLPEVNTAIAAGQIVVICEGEKDCDNLSARGFCATTTAGGAGNRNVWKTIAPQFFKGARVCIIPDNDKAGTDYAATAAESLVQVAAAVQILALPGLLPKGDVSDWLSAGGSPDSLKALIVGAPTREQWSASFTVGLPIIETNNRQQREISDDLLKAVKAANDPPLLFVRAGQLTRIGMDENGRPKTETVDEDVLAHVATRAANFVSTSEKRGTVAVKPPSHALCDLIHAPNWPGLPPLAGIVTSPVIAPNGELVTTPGYMADARLYYHESQTFILPDTTPTPATVTNAVSLLLDVLLGDFPFTDQSSRANALALLLLPFVRPYIDGPTPLHLIDAPAAGTGKTLLGRIIASVFLPGGPPLSSAPTNRSGSDDEEWRKKLASALRGGGPFCFIDNISGTLASPTLDAILTAREWTDRELGRMSMVTMPVLCTFIGTANNVTVGGDTDRRTVWIRIDSKVERPEDRGGFKIADIEEFVREERPRLLAAVLTLLRAWIDAKRPKWTGSPVGSFERWSSAIGGILDVAGVSGFLGNREEMHNRLDPEREKWTTFFHAWHDVHCSEKVGVADVAALAWGLDLIENVDRPGKTVLGNLLRSKVDRVFNGLRLESRGTKNGIAQYRIVSSITLKIDLDNVPNVPEVPPQPSAIDVSEESNGDTDNTYRGAEDKGTVGTVGTLLPDEPQPTKTVRL